MSHNPELNKGYPEEEKERKENTKRQRFSLPSRHQRVAEGILNSSMENIKKILERKKREREEREAAEKR